MGPLAALSVAVMALGLSTCGGSSDAETGTGSDDVTTTTAATTTTTALPNSE